MHNAVSRIALSLTGTALLAGGFAAAGPAAADTSQRSPAPALAPAAPGTYVPLTPFRLLDTRSTAPVGPVGPTATYVLKVAGRGGVPAGAGSVVLNVTAVSPTSAGYLTVWPSGTRPVVSNLNFVAGQIVANQVTVPIGADGNVRIFNGSAGKTHVLVDVSGAFTASAGATAQGSFTPLATPTRLLDTRSSKAIPALGSLTLPVRNTGGVSKTAGAVALNVTAVTPGAAGYVTLYPGGDRPTTSAVNFTTGRTVATAAEVRLSDAGSVTIFNGSAKPLQVLVDAAGWFRGTTGSTAATFSFLPPARILDTRHAIGHQGAVAAGATLAQAVGGAGGIPVKGVSAVVLTVTVTGTAGAGYLTVFPDGKRPLASTLNFTKGQTVTNLVVVPVAAVDDQLQLSYYNGSGGSFSLVADVSAFVRTADLSVPAAGTSHYVRTSIAAGDNASTIVQTFSAIGQADAAAVADDGDPQVTLLQFGAQTKVGTAGPGGGVRLSGTDTRLTYAQVVAAVDGYVVGYVNGRGSADFPVTVAVGTSSSGFAGSTYSPADKGTDWADKVVEPAVADTAGIGSGVTVVGASDIEANFDAAISEVKTWITAYLAAGPNALVNNGAAVQCPTVLGQLSRSCGPVQVDKDSPSDPTVVHTWTQADYQAVSGGLSSTGRLTVLPQIYTAANADQWENISRTGIVAGKPALAYAGALTSHAACAPRNSGCSSLVPADAWTALTDALRSDESTASTTVPAVTDLTVN